MISVITPVYNGKRFIVSCIQNVIDQNCSDFEHIIVDGGSTDGTVDIIRQYAKKYSHMHVISEKDKGQSEAMNKGIAKARGNILGFLNVDDYYEPNALNKMVDYFKNNKDALFVAGECRVFFSNGRIVHSKPRVSFMAMLQWWNFDFPLNPSSYFYSPEIHNDIGLYDENDDYLMDYDFLLRVSKRFDIQLIDTILGNYRALPGCKSVDNAASNIVNLQKISLNYQKNLNLLARLYIMLLYNVKHRKVFRIISAKKLQEYIFRLIHK